MDKRVRLGFWDEFRKTITLLFIFTCILIILFAVLSLLEFDGYISYNADNAVFWKSLKFVLKQKLPDMVKGIVF